MILPRAKRIALAPVAPAIARRARVGRARAGSRRGCARRNERISAYSSAAFEARKRVDRPMDDVPAVMDAEVHKRAAAARALELLRPGLRLGLGTGSTAAYFVELVGERVRAGLDLVAVATSLATAEQARRCGIPLTTLEETPVLDLTVDGADEIAPDLTLIKGGGGALLREKIVASASAKMVVIADQSKLVEVLGRFPLPIEIAPFGATATRRAIEQATAAAGCPGPARPRRLPNGHPFVTDGGH